MSQVGDSGDSARVEISKMLRIQPLCFRSISEIIRIQTSYVKFPRTPKGGEQ